MAHGRARGQPLLVLAVLLSGWIGARALAWNLLPDAPEYAVVAAVPDAAPAQPAHLAEPAPHKQAHGANPVAQAPAAPALLPPAWQRDATPLAPVATPVPAVRPLPEPVPLAPETLASGTLAGPVAPASAATRRMMAAGGHQMLWLAAAAMLPMPADLAAPTVRRPGPRGAGLPRWSADGWVFLRRGGGDPITFPRLSGGGNYGSSQMGAVLRYRIAPDSPHRPALYLRGAGALNGTREQEVALGASARLMPRLPVAAMAELRATRDGQGLSARPAVALVSELAPQTLPLGFTGEAYVQAGWVGGRAATAYVDGLVRAERGVMTGHGLDLRAGAGAWGAKQRGAARLDVGPVASVRVSLGDTTSARLEADWRFRIAGRAHPGSGPALTLSAGF
ncbi:hypothetical protein ACFOD9_06005 [Novosphingobium bradum]|uniref:Uncharacterized protein n=1 Tax=Novosphingobium bradum TaxID=1737444 RepID=A0ABV7IQD5_9SPHN